MQSYKSVLTSYYNVNACVCAGLLKTAQCMYVRMCVYVSVDDDRYNAYHHM